jgi:hypothetical protein
LPAQQAGVKRYAVQLTQAGQQPFDIPSGQDSPFHLPLPFIVFWLPAYSCKLIKSGVEHVYTTLVVDGAEFTLRLHEDPLCPAPLTRSYAQ